MNKIQEIEAFYRVFKPFMQSGAIGGRSCSPAKSIVAMLCDHGIKSRYIDGAKIMTIENISICVITPEMRYTVGSIFIAASGEDGKEQECVPFSQVIMVLAKLAGAGRKEPPFVDPEPASEFLLQYYWKFLEELFEKETSNG